MPKCETCGERLCDDYAIKLHKCPPRLECALIEQIEDREEWGDEADEVEWIVIYARCPVEAAERFAYRYLKTEGALSVRVRNEHGVEIDLKVDGEYELRFNAWPVGRIADPGYWDRHKLAHSSEFHKLTESVTDATSSLSGTKGREPDGEAASISLPDIASPAGLILPER